MLKLTEGNAATMRTASGKICLSEDRVDEDSILVVHHTDVNSYNAMMKCKGILTQVGGTLSHAPIVARELNKACLIACKDLEIDLDKRCIKIRDKVIPEGTMIIVDGMTGGVYLK